MAIAASNAVEVRVEKLSQLFTTLDPFPFRERDLDKDAEEFIVDWARELPHDQAIRIVVHLPDDEAKTIEAAELSQTLTRYFQYREEIVKLDLNQLFRVGRRSLAIGLTVLAACLALNSVIARYLAPTGVWRFIEEGLIIFGWVANWKPIEIFLYDWWPIAERRRLYRRLSQAGVEVKPAGARPSDPDTARPAAARAGRE